MQVQILIKGLPESAKWRRFAARRLDLALARFAHVIVGANMRLGDINGPERGGVDKLCRVVLRMKDSSLLVVEELGCDIGQAIERVLERLHQTIGRQLSRIARIDRNGMRRNILAGSDA